jgi:molybdopterin-guanine dinucleotide biosynthesis protein A
VHCRDLLTRFSGSVLVSVRAGQATAEPYTSLPLVLDDPGIAGPAAGLLAAWAAHARAALLVLACDLPRVDTATREFLVAHRDPAALATAFRHPNGVLEPLCAIFEPAAAGELLAAAEADGAPSLRRLLEAGPVRVLEPPEPVRIVSCNTPEALAAARATLRS